MLLVGNVIEVSVVFFFDLWEVAISEAVLMREKLRTEHLGKKVSFMNGKKDSRGDGTHYKISYELVVKEQFAVVGDVFGGFSFLFDQFG